MAQRSFRGRRPVLPSVVRGLELLESRQLLAGVPVSLGDINQTPDQLNPHGAVQVGNVAFFAGCASSGDGDELFKTDGTRAGTVLVKDINPTAGSSPNDLTNFNGTLFFAANDGVSGSELWRSDGTAAGTVRVTDLAAGAASSSPTWLTSFNGSLYFTAATTASGSPTLFKTDGTAAGTVAVTAGGAALTGAANLVVANGALLFKATSATGTGLYRLDASGNAGFIAGSPANPTALVGAGGVVYFENAGPSTDAGTGPVGLWRTDGTTAGTQLIRSFDDPLSYGGTVVYDGTSVTGLTVSGDRLYFEVGGGNAPEALWASDGTAAGTQVVFDGPGTLGYAFLQPVGTRSVLFTATTAAAGTEPWVSDGTAAGTTLLVDSVAGSASGQFGGAVPLPGGRSLFVTSGASGTSPQIWTTDGTPAGTTPAVTLPPGPGTAYPVGTLNGVVLLNVPADAAGGTFYRSDGTAAGTAVIGATLPGDGDGIVQQTTPAFFAAGNTVYFDADDGVSGVELYQSVDGAPPTQVADLAPGFASSDPAAFVATDDGSVYFSAVVSGTDASLFRLAPGSSTPQAVFSAAGAGQYFQTFAVGEQVYFTAGGTAAGHDVLWHYDPAANTSRMVIAGGASVEISSFIRSGNYGYFGDYEDPSELYRVGSAGDAQLAAVGYVDGSSPEVLNFLAGDGTTTFFTAYTAETGLELWKTDNSQISGTRLVSDLAPGTGNTSFLISQNPPLLVGGVLYFEASVKNGPSKTYRSDGTKAGTYAISGIAGGSSFTACGGKVYCIAPVGTSGTQYAIFRINGSSAQQLTTPGTGDTAFSPLYSLVAVGNSILATGIGGNDARAELWEADPGFTNFRRAAVLAPLDATGTGGTLGNFFEFGSDAVTSTASAAYFAMFTPATGVEPYRLSVGPAASAGGTVFVDANGNGVRDSGEAGLSGVTVYVDADGDNTLDAGEASTITDASGNFALTGLSDTGSATRLRVIAPAGYAQTLPAGNAGVALGLSPGATNAGLLLGLRIPPAVATATLSGFVFDDTNKDGLYESTETKTSGKTVFLDTNNNGKLDTGEKSVTTGSGGAWSFSGLAAGTYHVRRVFPSGYSQSNALLDVTLTAGQAVSGLFIGSRSGTTPVTPPTDPKTASLTGYAFDDANGDGILDGADKYTAGKRVFLDLDNDGLLDANETSVLTDGSGKFSFTGLAAGTYHVRRVFAAGYVASTAAIDLTLTNGQAKTGLLIGTKKA